MAMRNVVLVCNLSGKMFECIQSLFQDTNSPQRDAGGNIQENVLNLTVVQCWNMVQFSIVLGRLSVSIY